ncbi:FG-GAP repeat domain-containing protein [Thalassotalea agarivorans]|uniref:FG-GAP repeat domain-containing protein n=1 Tax=Thalassotalea agarivorans TaxID=349064 RepID=UPI000B8A4996|nr:VCBS repeat-containing protein [Thalassotalea agarivorans]
MTVFFAQGQEFNQGKLTSPHPLIYSPFTLNIDGGSDLEVVSIGEDDNGVKFLLVWKVENAQKAELLAQYRIPSGVFAFDYYLPKKEQKQDKQTLYFMSQSGIFALTWQDKNFIWQPLQTVSSIYLKDNPRYIGRRSFIYDLNSDGKPEAVLPDFDSINVYTNLGSEESLSQSIAIKPIVQLEGDGARFITRDLYFADMNGDTKKDIVNVIDGKVVYFPQQNNGLFELQGEVIDIEPTISGTDWWHQRNSSGESLDQSNLVYRRLEKLEDINDDALPDMVVRYTKSEGVLDRVNDYEIYFGRQEAGNIYYHLTADTKIQMDGTLTGFNFVDYDNDGIREVLVSGFDIGISQIIGALLSGSIDQKVYMFKLSGRNYPKKPNVKREVELNFSLTKGQTGFPVVQLGDFNGDGLDDMVLSDDDDEIRVYAGVRSKSLFTKKSKGVDIDLPADGNSVFIADINGDGKDDVLFKYGRLDEEKSDTDIIYMLAK